MSSHNLKITLRNLYRLGMELSLKSFKKSLKMRYKWRRTQNNNKNFVENIEIKYLWNMKHAFTIPVHKSGATDKVENVDQYQFYQW